MVEVGRKMRKGEDKEVLKIGMDLYLTLVILVEDYWLAMNQYQSEIPGRSEFFALRSLRGGRSLDDVSAEERRSFQEQDSFGRNSCQLSDSVSQTSSFVLPYRAHYNPSSPLPPRLPPSTVPPASPLPFLSIYPPCPTNL